MKVNLNFVQIDMDQFFTIRTDFCHLAVEIDRIIATRTTRYHNSNDLGLLLHVLAILSQILEID